LKKETDDEKKKKTRLVTKVRRMGRGMKRENIIAKTSHMT
jgi:hypothetical protein